mmetsp:Transcript_76731/g.176009  ORF Transcript_76731/g.176009 Transcript_76731/m.176009 type:complete len:153 (-) Transcript_76731:442-900(-)
MWQQQLAAVSEELQRCGELEEQNIVLRTVCQQSQQETVALREKLSQAIADLEEVRARSAGNATTRAADSGPENQGWFQKLVGATQQGPVPDVGPKEKALLTARSLAGFSGLSTFEPQELEAICSVVGSQLMQVEEDLRVAGRFSAAVVLGES